MFNDLRKQIPESEPDLKIGPLSLWVPGYTWINQVGQGNLAYLKTPTLLDTENAIIFSNGSETPLFTFKKFLNGLSTMYETVGTVQIVELLSGDSEFSVRLDNDLGQIKVIIKYNGWTLDGSLEFEDRIDQSYLPKIILDLKKTISKFA